MADTIINTPRASETADSAAAGWAIVLVVLFAVLIAGFFLFRSAAVQNPAVPNTGTDINVTIPDGNSGGNTENGGNTNSGTSY